MGAAATETGLGACAAAEGVATFGGPTAGGGVGLAAVVGAACDSGALEDAGEPELQATDASPISMVADIVSIRSRRFINHSFIGMTI